ncbi:putative maltose permease [Hortaea werneckii]|nr:putative maltose permease [Hortaea werneckii]KAI6807749.1 putative maltose permease [Hortaea werneckii]KAI6923496.1 putative maltose permease [Hortaea werneckii]KAI6936516.1 putative maltose permease [Hortaea werneckii]KAI6972773.1 putative maltose permease [Hortaea werneckii]
MERRSRGQIVNSSKTGNVQLAGPEAQEATENEHNLSFIEAIKLYPKAVGWSIFFSLGVIMTAFDPQLLGNLYATPAFQRDFGYFYDGSYIVSAPWQTGLSMGNPIGQVIGAFFAAYPMEWFGRKRTFGAAHAPFAAQWFWPLVILIGWPFAPESPWWLVRKGRTEDAERSLRRLASTKVDVRPTLAMIATTDQLEQELEAGTTYRDCLQKANLRRTEIAVGVYCIQVVSGVCLVGYATYFFEQAGLPVDRAFDMGIGFLALGVVGTILSWVLLVRFGRRVIYNTGLGLLILLLFLIGILDCIHRYENHTNVIWAQSSLMLVWNFCYDFSVGPICFVILCEVSATKLRSKTIALATASQALLGIVMTIVIPYMINPDEADLGGKMGFFFGALSALGLVWSFFRVPETRERTYEELDIMFSRRVPTRQFKSWRMD